ncbi:MAG: cobyric acid synthase [Lentisphaeraceae bacterium]|nr:cobyric acid synthase [Lentisphaeraceae bacterium]
MSSISDNNPRREPPAWLRSFVSRNLESCYVENENLYGEFLETASSFLKIPTEQLFATSSIKIDTDLTLEFSTSFTPKENSLNLVNLCAALGLPGKKLWLCILPKGISAQNLNLDKSSLDQLTLLICQEAFVQKEFSKKSSDITKTVTKKKTPSLMIQGTASNAGKSILTAAFCRILLQDGYKVAPFKSQNMSLNSYVTHDGLEIPRAQVVQAQACRIDPDIRMGPVLLKPNADTQSQIILNGKPIENMTWQGYTNYKEKAFTEIKKSYDSLADEFDVLVLEGAGSPAEVNLKKNDIVNLGMAHYANAPVLVSGDIDRGGVYASFVGTTEVLLPWERELIKGFLVNRFRGDASLLGDAHEFVQYHTGCPVLGVIPYIHDLGLPEEDDISFKELKQNNNQDFLDIVLIGLPKISNFTDVDAFDVEDDVQMRIARKAEDIGTPDCIIIPGSKSTIKDFIHLKESGKAAKIQELLHQTNCQVVGICGGFQMLGKSIKDPHNIESSVKEIDGLTLLDIETEMAVNKTLKQVKLANNVEGYEIHHGHTTLGSDLVIHEDGGEILGVQSRALNVWGTYIHGIFDNDTYRWQFLNELRKQKGIYLKDKPTAYNLEPAFDQLASVVRESVDLDKIYQIMGL